MVSDKSLNCVDRETVVTATLYASWGSRLGELAPAARKSQSCTPAARIKELGELRLWNRYFPPHHPSVCPSGLPCRVHLPVCLWIMDPHSRAPKKNTSHGNEVLPQDTTHLIQRPCYQRGSPCQDPAGNWITWRSPDDRKETQTAVVWSCFTLIGSGQNHLARHSERGKKTRQAEEEVGRQHQGMDRPGIRQVPEGGEEQGKMEKTCKLICSAPTTLTVKRLMMMMMISVPIVLWSGTLVYRFARQTARKKKKIFLRKTQCPRLIM